MVGGVGKKQKMTWQLRTIQGYVLILVYVLPQKGGRYRMLGEIGKIDKIVHKKLLLFLFRYTQIFYYIFQIMNNVTFLRKYFC